MPSTKHVVFQRLVVLVPLAMSAKVTWHGKHLLNRVGIVDHFQNYFILIPFLTSRLLLKFNVGVNFAYPVFFLPVLHPSRFFPFDFLFSYLYGLFFCVYCDVCLLFVVSFLPTFNVSVMLSMTILE